MPRPIIVLSTVLMTLPLRAGEPALAPRPTKARPVLVGNWADPTILEDGDEYCLTSAQGGTSGPATGHMVVSARSKGPLRPWENSPYNPIIRTWDRDQAWWSKGHGTLVEGPGKNSLLLQIHRRRMGHPST